MHCQVTNGVMHAFTSCILLGCFAQSNVTACMHAPLLSYFIAEGGIGKTTLAKALYNRLLDSFSSSSAAIVELADDQAVAKPVSEVLTAVMKGLGRKEPPQDIGLVDYLLARDERVLLLLDNAWDPDKLTEVLRRLRHISPMSVVIATSRDETTFRGVEECPSHLHGRHDSHGGSFPAVFIPHCVEGLRPDAAADWFAACTASYRPADQETRELEQKILGKCGGHPLLLRLVAGHITTNRVLPATWQVSLLGLVAEYEQPFQPIVVIQLS